MNVSLKNIVDESYSLFEQYRVELPLDVCTECCVSKSQAIQLVSLAVNQIPFELLYEYNTAAKTANPGLDEFKHFLPRFLDLTADLKFLHHSVELVLSRFEYYGDTDWTCEERDLIQRFAEALFKHSLTIYPLPGLDKIDSILIMLYKADVDILKVLEHWATIKSHSSVLHLSDLYFNGFKGDTQTTLSSGFATEELSLIVSNWLKSAFSLVDLEPQIEEIIMNPEGLEEWKLNELNWTYIKLNEFKHKMDTLSD